MLENFNKIWSESSVLNNDVERKLFEQAIADPDQPLDTGSLKVGESDKTVTKQTVGLFFEKVGLTIQLVFPILRDKVIDAFKKVEDLKGRVKSEKDYNEAMSKLRDKEINAGVGSYEKKVEEINNELDLVKADYSAKAKGIASDSPKEKEKMVEIEKKLSLIKAFTDSKKQVEDLTDQMKSNPQVSKTDAYQNFLKFQKEMNENKLPTETNQIKETVTELKKYLEEIEGRKLELMTRKDELVKLEEKYVELSFEKEQLLVKKETFMIEAKLKERKADSSQDRPVEKDEMKKIFLDELQNRRNDLSDTTIEVPPLTIEESKVSDSSQVKIEEKAVELSGQDLMLKDIEDYIHKDIQTVWKGLFDKFEAGVVKSWSCDGDGNFKLELNKPMRAWIPSTDEKTEKRDPSSGVVLLLGIDDTGKEVNMVSGKLDKANKDIMFKGGFNLYVKPDSSVAKPGYINMTNLKYVDDTNIRVLTQKDFRKDGYGSWTISIVAAVAKTYGTVDENYILTVDKQRSLKNLIDNWNTNAKPVENEKKALGVK